ncbi:MAG: hypothetical protein M1817_004170 [Caeruleum heppii]|nr:MAG: hypothetical protein M1817_004170 [Caeruleum heppii]
MSHHINIPSRSLRPEPSHFSPTPRSYSSSPASSSSTPSSAAFSTPSPSNLSKPPSSCTYPSGVSASHREEAAKRWGHERRPSLLGASISMQEHTVINVGHPDGPPRLITCVKASQGFDWNQDIFLPSYADHDSADLERKQDPVHEIVLTEDEIRELFPQ